jgi:alginate O-acetyltransferase complex protein AlgI
MVAIVVVLLLAVKAIVARDLTFGQWLAFALWFGMRPSIFASLGGPPRDGSAKLAAAGLRNLVAGALFLVTARLVVLAFPPVIARWCATPLLLVGLSLILHFGFLNLVTSFWRTRGVAAERLFRDPLHATSLADFWSHRWNLGFAEMTALMIHRPLRGLAGRKVALMASFLVSGLLHELAISVPVRGGYGLPTLYFVIQGALVASGIRSRPVMFFGLIAPLLLVFHLPFLRGVIWPLVGLR